MSDTLRRRRPHGLNDLFFEQAAIKTTLENLLLETFERWGYQRVILPTFGYYESLLPGASPQLQQEMYRFFDREGNVLALRADMTVPTARLVGTRLYDHPKPLRFCYSGSVFRHEKPQAGQRHEFTQAGVELIGAATPEADAEVIALAVAALQALGIREFQITLGQVGYLRAILQEVGLQNGGQYEIEQAIGRKNDRELASLIEGLGLPEGMAQTIRALPHLYGGPEILPRAYALACNQSARETIAYLQEVYNLLRAQGVAEHIILDLGEVRSMAYYTGIAFHGYVRGLGFHVCSGGRYDDLIGHFGPPMPAVGFAIGIERAMLVTQPPVDLGPDLLLSFDIPEEGYRVAQRARANGLRVEVDVLKRHGQTLMEYGQARKVPRILEHTPNGQWMLYEGNSKRSLTLAQLWQEIDQWTH